MTGTHYAIGDIHGCETALCTLLDALPYTSQDTIVVLGDVVDRGPGTRGVIDRLLALSSEVRLVLIRGNHEDMLLGALDGSLSERFWLRYGGRQVLESYGGSSKDIPQAHLDFLAAAIDWYETDTEIYVHANLDVDQPLSAQTANDLRWEHLNGDEPPASDGRRIICGHTAQKDGKPWLLSGRVCIDTCAHHGGWLTALDVQTDQVWQANEQGQWQGPQSLADVAKR